MQVLVFTCLQYKSFANTEGNGEIACNEQFLLSHNFFYPLVYKKGGGSLYLQKV